MNYDVSHTASFPTKWHYSLWAVQRKQHMDVLWAELHPPKIHVLKS